jgi:transcriptional regulator with XRE-family HTH domain
MTLKQVRAMKGMTQQDVANALNAIGRNANQSYVSQIEGGESSPTIDLAIDLAVAYGVTIVEVITALGYDLSGVWHDLDN